MADAITVSILYEKGATMKRHLEMQPKTEVSILYE